MRAEAGEIMRTAGLLGNHEVITLCSAHCAGPRTLELMNNYTAALETIIHHSSAARSRGN